MAEHLKIIKLEYLMTQRIHRKFLWKTHSKSRVWPCSAQLVSDLFSFGVLSFYTNNYNEAWNVIRLRLVI